MPFFVNFASLTFCSNYKGSLLKKKFKYIQLFLIATTKLNFTDNTISVASSNLNFSLYTSVEMNSQSFLKIGNVYTDTKSTSSQYVALRRFKSFFGVTPLACSLIWNKIKKSVPSSGKPKHLLWSLCFLKQYSLEHNRRAIFHADEKTIRKWTWIFVELLSELDVIDWENRFERAADGQTCFVSIDGIDFKIDEPKPFNKGWFSHKFRSAGLRYEIALNIRTGLIVWVFGGYPCGLYPDLKLAKEAFIPSLIRGERALADKGYKDPTHFILPNIYNSKEHEL